MTNLLFLAIIFWACNALLSNKLLKVTATLSIWTAGPLDTPLEPVASITPTKRRDMARVSIIIALYRETEMIEQLLHQIARLRYPKAQLDVLLYN